MTDIFKRLSENGIDAVSDAPLSKMSTFRIGGRADAVAYPDSADALICAVREAKACGISFIVIGNGSNTLFSDEAIADLSSRLRE